MGMFLKITKIMILGANLKFSKLIVLVFKRGSKSKWIRLLEGGTIWATSFVLQCSRWGNSKHSKYSGF
jgi:hypothetical protein